MTDYDATVNTITFSPARSSSITTENYVLRRSYRVKLISPGKKVVEDLNKNAKRALFTH